MYAMYLAANGFRYVMAGDGATAIRVALGAQPDVIVMDLSLPQIDGWEATRWLKQNSSTAHIPIVACTGRVEGHSGVDAIAAGCDDVLKPCLSEHPLKEIRTLLDRPRGQRRA